MSILTSSPDPVQLQEHRPPRPQATRPLVVLLAVADRHVEEPPGVEVRLHDGPGDPEPLLVLLELELVAGAWQLAAMPTTGA